MSDYDNFKLILIFSIYLTLKTNKFSDQITPSGNGEKNIPHPGVEPGPPGWEPGILTR